MVRSLPTRDEGESEQEQHRESEALHAEQIPRIRSEMVEEGGVVRLVHHEGVVGPEGEIDEIDREEVAVDDEEGAEDCLPQGPSRPPAKPEREQERGCDYEVMELKEGEEVRMRKGLLEVWGEQSLEGAAEPAVVGHFAEHGLAEEEGKGGHEGGEIAEMEGDEAVELSSLAHEEAAATGVHCRSEAGKDDDPACDARGP